MIFNRTVRFSEQFEFNPRSFAGSRVLKDCSFNFIVKEAPSYLPLIAHLVSLMPPKKYLTIDLHEQNFTQDYFRTCRDLTWHVDGIDNSYVIWSVGSFRTEFISQAFEIHNLACNDIRSVNESVKFCLKAESPQFAEIPASRPVIYSSSDVHRGRRAEPGAKRVLVRLCHSDYLVPKNKVLIDTTAGKHIRRV